MKKLAFLILLIPFYSQAQTDSITSKQLLLKIEAQQNTMIDLFHLLDENIALSNQLRRRIRNLETMLLPVKKLSGTIFSYGGSVNNNSHINLFDGNFNTFWHSKAASGAYVGFAFDTARVVREFRYAARKNQGSPKNFQNFIRGAKVQGSNESESSGFIDLYEIDKNSIQQTDANTLVGVLLDNENAYKWIRVLFPEDSYGFASEIEFWGY